MLNLRMRDTVYFDVVPYRSCLNLNVQSPSVEGSRPVFIFIHGGGNNSGSNLELGLYNGDQLSASQDMVVVSINYRVQIFGYV